MNAERLTLRAWLLSDAPASRSQAALGLAPTLASFRRESAQPVRRDSRRADRRRDRRPADHAARPAAQVLSDRLLPPGSPSHWLGTDQLGRDILSRLIAGSRLTLGIAILVVVIVVPIGLLIGTTAGYCGGFVDSVLMRITDIALAFPKIVLALAFAAALGPGVINAVVAISITAWPRMRGSRARRRSASRRPTSSTPRACRARRLRILLRYIMPLCMSSVIVRATLDMAGIILTVAGLGFLGLGAQPPAGASWSRRGATCCSTRGGSRRCPAARFCS